MLLRILRVLLLAWIFTYVGALAGWVIGAQLGRQDGFLGAVVVGTLTLLLVLKVLARMRWFNYERRRGGSIGGLCGFALAAPLAAMNIDTPLISFLCMALVGIGVIAGAGPRGSVRIPPE